MMLGLGRRSRMLASTGAVARARVRVRGMTTLPPHWPRQGCSSQRALAAGKHANNIKGTHTAFTGHVRTDPRGEHTLIFNPLAPEGGNYLEVESADIGLSEQTQLLVNEAGESWLCSRVWVRQGSVVRRVTPFQI